ncbi:hypothetical protein BDN70DRAFT_938223 [Pholiota conissans]|uniref:Uncharacterized protein n=1 Tax=Pholiota conissans TaxID=109636 RepID=A0A9P5YPL5_9AGAR|nr:hypothetical protein BDN70DRAFT_938223 [Pholiota conissans]
MANSHNFLRTPPGLARTNSSPDMTYQPFRQRGRSPTHQGSSNGRYHSLQQQPPPFQSPPPHFGGLGIAGSPPFATSHPMNSQPPGTLVDPADLINQLWANHNKSLLDQKAALMETLNATFTEFRLEIEAKAKITDTRAADLAEIKEKQHNQLVQKLQTAVKNLQEELKLRNIAAKKEIEDLVAQFKKDAETASAETALEHIKQIAELTSQLEQLNADVKNLERWAITGDVFALIRIRFRRLMDEVIRLLYEALTGEVADDKLMVVKSWWASKLNPRINQRKAKATGSKSAAGQPTKQQPPSDDERYQTCLKLISNKKLNDLPEYKALVDSGTLKFVTQGTTQLREEANYQAHDLLDMERFRTLLEQAEKDKDGELICPRKEVPSVRGLIHFVEATRAKQGAIIKTTVTVTTERWDTVRH